MRTVFNLLRATLTPEKEKKWPTAVAAVEDDLSVTVHTTTGPVPAVLQLGLNPRLAATREFLGDAPLDDNFVDPQMAVKEARVRVSRAAQDQAR